MPSMLLAGGERTTWWSHSLFCLSYVAYMVSTSGCAADRAPDASEAKRWIKHVESLRT